MAPPKLVFSPPAEPPFPVDALVEEEDSYLSLSAEPTIEFPAEHPMRVMTAAREAEELEPGTVVVRSGDPLRLLAVVHRLHESPTWQERWIADAIENLRVEVERRWIQALGTPLLGTVHGTLSPRRSLELLAPLLAEDMGLARIWVMRAGAPPR
jgi:hypothetical protein